MNGDRFGTTSWSVILATKDSEPQVAREALGALCEHYWKPVYTYIRLNGHGLDDAADLTQEFFTRLLEAGKIGEVSPDKGRFRSYILAAVKHFLSNERKRIDTKKRGGGLAFLSLDAIMHEDIGLEVGAGLNPDVAYDRKWALSLLGRTLERLEEEQRHKGRLKEFLILRPLLTGDAADKSYLEIGRELGLKEGSVKSAVHRLRKRYGKVLEEEVQQIVTRKEDVRDEIHNLFSALGR